MQALFPIGALMAVALAGSASASPTILRCEIHGSIEGIRTNPASGTTTAKIHIDTVRIASAKDLERGVICKARPGFREDLVVDPESPVRLNVREHLLRRVRIERVAVIDAGGGSESYKVMELLPSLE